LKRRQPEEKSSSWSPLRTSAGQAVNSAIGTFCGLYSNGPEITRLTYGVADDILSDLLKDAAARDLPARNSMIVQYDDTALGRWVDRTV
jgi:hypothetical protein